VTYGYARCSTDDQKQDITRQERDLKAVGAKKIFREYASGTNPDREELQRLWEKLAQGDTVAVTELSRITRNVHHLCHILEDAQAKKIIIRAGSLTVDCTDGIEPMAECMAIVLGAFAQLEQRQTVTRIKSGVANARAKGKSIGRPKKTPRSLPDAFKDNLGAFRLGTITTAQFGALCGVSRQTLYRWIKILEKQEVTT